MGLNGLEPATSRLSGVRSNHLSYRPMTGARGLEPPAFGFGDRRSTTELCPYTAQEVPLNRVSIELTCRVYQRLIRHARLLYENLTVAVQVFQFLGHIADGMQIRQHVVINLNIKFILNIHHHLNQIQ